jgi:hypothetical protein
VLQQWVQQMPRRQGVGRDVRRECLAWKSAFTASGMALMILLALRRELAVECLEQNDRIPMSINQIA